MQLQEEKRMPITKKMHHKNIVYKAIVSSPQESKQYIGLTATSYRAQCYIENSIQRQFMNEHKRTNLFDSSMWLMPSLRNQISACHGQTKTICLRQMRHTPRRTVPRRKRRQPLSPTTKADQLGHNSHINFPVIILIFQ